MKPPYCLIFILVTAFSPFQVTQAAITVIEARLSLPLLVGGATLQFGTGSAFFKIDGDTIEYQIWVDSNTTLSPTMAFAGNLLGANMALPLIGTVENRSIGGRDPIPVNPYLQYLFPPGVVVPVNPPPPGTVGIPIMIVYDVFGASVIDATLARALEAASNTSASVTAVDYISGFRVLGPYSGSLAAVSIPEPSCIVILLCSSPVILHRRRNRTTHRTECPLSPTIANSTTF